MCTLHPEKTQWAKKHRSRNKVDSIESVKCHNPNEVTRPQI